MSTKRAKRKSTPEKPPNPEPPKGDPEPVNTEESETDGLRRLWHEAADERDILRDQLGTTQSEVSQLKAAVYSHLVTEDRLLSALIADGEALLTYRKQARAATRKLICEIDAAKARGKSSSGPVWSAFRWEPISEIDDIKTGIMSASVRVER